MLPKEHIIYGLIFSILIYVFFDISLVYTLVIFLSSFLIDIDHYLYYVYKTKNFSLKKANQWYFVNLKKFNKMTAEQKEGIYTGLCFLHGFEAMAILLFLYFISPAFNFAIYVLIGFAFHQVLDAIDLYIRRYRFDKVISFTFSVIRARNKKLLQDYG